MNKILTFIIKLLNLKDNKRFNNEWKNGIIIKTVYMLLKNLIRGFFRRLFFKSTSGMVLIGKSVTIRFANYISAGKNLIIEDNCEINGFSRRGIQFGDKVTIGSYAIIRPTNFYGGEPGEGLKIGNNSNIGPYSYIGCSGYIEIGNNVMMSPRVGLYAENHNFSTTDIPMKEQGVTRQSIIIEDDCWIASNTVILAGVTIGKGSVIASGSVVNKSVPPYSIVGGVPAKIIKNRKPE